LVGRLRIWLRDRELARSAAELAAVVLVCAGPNQLSPWRSGERNLQCGEGRL